MKSLILIVFFLVIFLNVKSQELTKERFIDFRMVLDRDQNLRIEVEKSGLAPQYFDGKTTAIGKLKTSPAVFKGLPLLYNNHPSYDIISYYGIFLWWLIDVFISKNRAKKYNLIKSSPTQYVVKMSFENDFYNVAKVIDSQSKILQEKRISQNETELIFDLESLDAGNYLIQLEGTAGLLVKKVRK